MDNILDKEYNASSIKSLTQHQHLLKRLSLTFGSETGDKNYPYSSQKSVAIREIVDNSLDELRAGFGEKMKISFFSDGSVAVQDSGRGIPVDVGQTADGKPASGVFLCLGVIQSGGKFGVDSKRFSSGLNGLGSSAVIHCSKRADVTVYRNNKRYELSFQDGVPGFFDGEGADAKFEPLTDLTYLKVSKDDRSAAEKKDYKTGTIVKTWLRDEVFQSPYPYEAEDIIARLKGTAFLVPNIIIDVYNEQNPIENPETGKLEPQTESFHFEGGIRDLVELLQPDPPITDTLYFNSETFFIEKNVPVLQEDGTIKGQDLKREVNVEVAFRWGEKYDTTMESYVNTIRTKLGGVHVTAFERALCGAFNERITSMRGMLSKGDEPPIVSDYLEGLTAVLHVQVSEPSFTSQSKEQLSGIEVRKAVQDLLADEFTKWINSSTNKERLVKIATKVSNAAKNRQRAKAQKELNRKKNAISEASLPVKLIDCMKAGGDEAELYICEGDSALGQMKAARNAEIHALLPIRGKPINAYKNSEHKILENKEVKALAAALGSGIGKSFDVDKCRYGKIFVAADADPDGSEIAVLVYTIFYNLFKPLVEQGRFFKVEPPLFVVQTGSGKKEERYYCRDEKERDKKVRELERRKVSYKITRLKGLGEMQADDLEETCLNPDTRIITQVTLNDVEGANDRFDLLFGSDTQIRKDWIDTFEFSFEDTK